jgi:hypothetical protein
MMCKEGEYGEMMLTRKNSGQMICDKVLFARLMF